MVTQVSALVCLLSHFIVYSLMVTRASLQVWLEFVWLIFVWLVFVWLIFVWLIFACQVFVWQEFVWLIFVWLAFYLSFRVENYRSVDVFSL